MKGAFGLLILLCTGPLSKWVVSANGPREWSSIPGQVIPKTQKKKKKKKIVLDASLFNTHYKERIMVKMEQSKEKSCALPFTSG